MFALAAGYAHNMTTRIALLFILSTCACATVPHDHAEDLLVRVLDRGTLVAPLPGLEAARARAARELAQLSPRTRRFMNPQPYPVGLDDHVHNRKLQLIAEASHA